MHEFNRDPWRKGQPYLDKTYPSGVARERPIATTRIHCAMDDDQRDLMDLVRDGEERCDLFNRQLRAGHAWRNEGEE